MLSRNRRPGLPLVGFVSVAALLAIAAVVSYMDARRLAETAAQVDEAHGAIERVRAVSLDIEFIVTTARVFMLTGDEELVAPLAPARQRLAEDFASLRGMLNDFGQLARLAMLEELAERRLELSLQYIDLRRRFGLQRAAQEIPPGGEQLAAEIRDLIAGIEQNLRVDLDQRRSVAAENHARTAMAITFFGSTSLVVLLAAFLGFRRQAAERAKLERQIVATGERERARIAGDLHDSLGQELTGISLRLEALSNTLQREGSAHTETVHGLKSLVQASIAESRRLSRSLFPGVWSDLGICAALRALAGEIDRLPDVACIAHCSDEDDISDGEVVAQLFRIAQEAVNNALRHAAPRHIELRFGRNGGTAELAILDDGTGIAHSRDRIEGLGLSSMRYRAGMIDGTLRVMARSQGGTEVRCSFTYPRSAAA